MKISLGMLTDTLAMNQGQIESFILNRLAVVQEGPLHGSCWEVNPCLAPVAETPDCLLTGRERERLSAAQRQRGDLGDAGTGQAGFPLLFFLPEQPPDLELCIIC